MKWLLFLYSSVCLANPGLDQLIGGAKNKNFEPIKIKRTTLNLDDPFLVQVYGQLREKGIKDKEILGVYDALFAKDYQSVLAGLDFHSHKEFINATKVYVLYRLGHAQSAVNLWIDLSKRPGFLDSQLAVALDQVVGQDASNWLIKKGIVLTKRQKLHLQKLGDYNLQFHYSLQGLAFLRAGDQGLKIIPFLEKKDPLRLELAKSLILFYARKGELSSAAKVLKGVFEPVLIESNDTEDISEYYLMLGRLLYQAKAFDAAWEYYQLIPDESRHYMTAQVESMWISIREQDFGRIKGHAKTLELDIFQKEFLPERHLVTAMAHLKTCQFEKVNHSFQYFLRENKRHARDITKQLGSDAPIVLDKKNFYMRGIQVAQKRLPLEFGKLKGYKGYQLGKLQDQIELVKKQRKQEARRQWRNRELILEQAIQRMRFVKVEYLSSMRRLKDKLARLQKNSDQVSTKSSSLKQPGNIVFPFDGMFFSDELFHVTSAVTNLCLKDGL
jgi:tetratricopeptide (TPR) repeat protein